MTKQRICLVVVLAVIVLMVSVAGESAAVTTLKVYGYLHDNLINATRDRFPNIELKVTNPGAVRITAYAEAAAGGEYDIIASNSLFTQPATQFLRPLDDLIKRDLFPVDRYVGNLAEQMNMNGKLYELPQWITPYTMHYNLQSFHAAGIEAPSSKWGWDDLRSASARLTNLAPSKRTYGVLAVGSDLWSLLAQQSGKGLLDGDEGTYAASLQLIADMTLSDQSMFIDVPTVGWKPSRLFSDGLAAMSISPYIYRTSFPLGLTLLPGRSEETRYTFTDVYSLAISAKARHPQEAWQVISYLAGPEAAPLLANARYLPAMLTPKALGIWTRAHWGYQPPIGIDCLMDLRLITNDRKYGKEDSDYGLRIRQVLMKVITGAMTMEEALAAAQRDRHAVIMRLQGK